jgi:recombinational DNA repair ATPase RecF
MPYDIWCFLIGSDNTFSVNIDETRTRTVDQLKKEIKAKNPKTFSDFDADDLTLYRAEVDESIDEQKQKRTDELRRLFHNLNECTELDEKQQLQGVFGENPQGKRYYTLVLPPEGESIGVVLMAGGVNAP